jgi:hypothetical protein
MAVGAVAAAYHASSGRLRRVMRKLDYYTIAYHTSAMAKAVLPDSWAARRGVNVGLVAVPFRPFLVSAGNTALMEVEYMRHAAANQVRRLELGQPSRSHCCDFSSHTWANLNGGTLPQ